MAKTENEAKRLARHTREEKELHRRRKQLERPKPKGYLIYLLVGIGSMGSSIAIMIGMIFVESIGLQSLCICGPFMLLALILLITQVSETKDVDLNTVTGAEWD